MEFKARADSIHQHNHLLLHLLLLLLLASFQSTMANKNDILPSDPGVPYEDRKVTYGFKPPADTTEEDPINKGHQLSEENYSQCAAELKCQCPSVCDCPLTLEPNDFKQLKDNLGPVIRHRLRELLKKALTVESATEAAHTIDLLKILDESNSELNRIRDKVHEGAQQLREAFEKIPEFM